MVRINKFGPELGSTYLFFVKHATRGWSLGHVKKRPKINDKPNTLVSEAVSIVEDAFNRELVVA